MNRRLRIKQKMDNLSKATDIQLLEFVRDILSRSGPLTIHDKHELALINNEFVIRDAIRASNPRTKV